MAKRTKSVTAEPIEEIQKEVLGDPEETQGEIPESAARELGALNAEAVQSNRRRERVLERKRAGESNVPWGEPNACLLYDDLVRLWSPNSLSIQVTRLTGTPCSWYLYGFPRSGRELYEMVKNQCHGRGPECQYEIAVRDAQGRFDRGKSRLIMPSNENESAPGGAAGYAQPPPATLAPSSGSPPGWAAPPQPMQPPAPAAMAPPQMAAAPSTDIATVMQLQRQLSELGAAIAALRAPQSAAAPAPQLAQPVAQAPIAAPALAAPAGYVIVVSATGQQVLVPASQLGLAGVPPPAAAAPAPAPAAPPAAPLSPEQQFAGALGLMRSAVESAVAMQNLFPQPLPAAPAPAASDASKKTTEVVQLGDIKAVQNVEDGSIRYLDTALANAGPIISWVEKQQAKLENAAAARAGQPPPNGAPGGQMAPPTMGQK